MLPHQPPKGSSKKPAPAPAAVAGKKPQAAKAPEDGRIEKRPRNFGRAYCSFARHPGPEPRQLLFRPLGCAPFMHLTPARTPCRRHWPGYHPEAAAEPLREVAEVRAHPAPAPRADQAPEGAKGARIPALPPATSASRRELTLLPLVSGAAGHQPVQQGPRQEPRYDSRRPFASAVTGEEIVRPAELVSSPAATNLFKLLLKYRPEDKAQKKVRPAPRAVLPCPAWADC